MAKTYVLSAVGKGFKVSFTKRPRLSRIPIQFPEPKNPERRKILEEEVKSMLKKGVIQPVKEPGLGFYSRIFTVPKKSGGYRPVIDLSPLNVSVVSPKFKMETAKSIRLSIRRGDFATSVDLKDAYFHVPMHKTSWKYLRFVWRGVVYQFIALPFGLSPAPYIFTRVTKPLAGLARAEGIRLKMYLDDWLNLNQSKTGSLVTTKRVIQLAQRLGFNIKPEKSDLIPSTTFKYLGMTFDTVKFLVRPNKDRVDSLIRQLHQLRHRRRTNLRTILSVLGKMESMALLIPLARVYKRPLQRLVAERAGKSQNMDKVIKLGPYFVQATNQWMKTHWVYSSVPIQNPEPKVFLHTDASKEGWGGHTSEHSVLGQWDTHQRKLHINLLEMESVFLCLKKFQNILTNKTVIVCGDNRACLYYLANQGGTKSRTLSLRAEQILIWAHQNNIFLETRFIPGKLNVLADQLSRSNQVLSTEWTITHQSLQPVWERLGKPMIDLFATKFSKRLPLYVSPVQDPEALAIDAFQMSWRGLDVYAYPPTALIPQVLAKTYQEKPCMVLIAPYWPTTAWFPELLNMAKEGPLPLNLRKGSLIQPRSGIPHSCPEKLNLAVWKL
jgi:hypothetical protein